ncbi:MAG: hypothetical protein ACRDEA_09930 [Microcystaceae cyanobacterium]
MIAQEIQTLKAFGIPYVEYRDEPDVTDILIISLEFQPEIHPNDDYGYFQPEFVFGDVVALREQWEYCCSNHIDFTEELDLFKVCAMELVEPRNRSGWLTEAPSWLIGIRCSNGTRELMWFNEEELISKREIEQDPEDLNEF